MKPWPSYLALSPLQLQERVDCALKQLESCSICPHDCRVNRNQDKKGRCRIGRKALVASFGAHMGEESCLRGANGSGTVFFSRCNLQCAFCQNCDIAHQGNGYSVTAANLAAIMLEIQNSNCHNLNLVTPSHIVPQILEALQIAISKGLHIPIVYNSGGYDKMETLLVLEGIVDIYMPDVKFLDARIAAELTIAPDYPEVVQLAVLEMHRQVGDLEIGANGLARSGLLVRHLVMPEGVSTTRQVMKFLAEKVSPATYINLMAQYHPAGAAWSIPQLRRAITESEYRQAYQDAQNAGIYRFDSRPLQRFGL